MTLALILSISVAIIFTALFLDERGTVKEYRDESKSQRAEIIRLRDSAQVTPVESGQAVVSKPSVDDQDLWDLTPDLVADVVKFNGYVPDKEDNAVYFMVQGDRYCVPTDMLPYVAIMKRYELSEGEYDIALMREAARKTTESRWLGKCGLSDDGKLLTFFIASIEPKYGHFRDEFGDYMAIVNQMEHLFDTNYNQMLRDKEDLAKLEANGIEIDNSGKREGQVLS